MRSIVSALAARGHAAAVAKASAAISAARAVVLISIAFVLFLKPMTIFDAHVCNGYANGETYSANCPCDDKSL
jgi:hypothetical protein